MAVAARRPAIATDERGCSRFLWPPSLNTSTLGERADGHYRATRPSVTARAVLVPGVAATLLLPTGSPEVLFEYLTEPPHGDPLYRVKIDRATVGGWKDPIPLFGRDIHLSDCARFLALTGLTRTGTAYHVLNLFERTRCTSPGFVQLESVSSTALRFRRYACDGLRVTPGKIEIAFFSSADWGPLTPSFARGAAP